MEKVHLIIDYQNRGMMMITGKKRTNKANKASKTSGKKYDNFKKSKEGKKVGNFNKIKNFALAVITTFWVSFLVFWALKIHLQKMMRKIYVKYIKEFQMVFLVQQ